jgi:hypothetical protein
MRVLRPTLWAERLDKIMATRKRHSPEQVVRKLTAADRLLAEGKDLAGLPLPSSLCCDLHAQVNLPPPDHG